MIIDPLDFRPVEVRKLQSMDKDSKEYKKLIQNLRFIYQVLPNSILYQMLISKSSTNHIEADEFHYSFIHKYRKYLFSIIVLSVLMFSIVFLGYLVIGDIEINQLNKLQTIVIILLSLALSISIIMIVIFTYKVRKIKNNYFDTRINDKKIRCAHFSDELLSSVSNAYEYTVNNRHIMGTNNEKCGCINCLKIFYSDEIKECNDKSVICPYCNTVNVIADNLGYPIDNYFLRAMKEYWIDNSN